MDLPAAVERYRAAQQAVADAKSALREGQDEVRAARAKMTEAVVAEARRGTRMRDLVKITGLSREWLRTLLRENGVYPED